MAREQPVRSHVPRGHGVVIHCDYQRGPSGSYLAVPIFDQRVPEAVYAAARCGDRYLGAARRAPSYPCNGWEGGVCWGGNCTCFIPLDKRVQGKTIDVVLLGLKECAGENSSSEVWVTAYPSPHICKRVTLAAPQLSATG